MSITHLMSEICNLAYLIVENIVEEQYERRSNGAAKIHRRKYAQRPQRPRDSFKYGAGPPGPHQRT
jgi:hypothetical protein